MMAVIVGGKSVAVFRREGTARLWAAKFLSERCGVSFRAVDMRLSLARSLYVINSRPRFRMPSFDLEIGAY